MNKFEFLQKLIQKTIIFRRNKFMNLDIHLEHKKVELTLSNKNLFWNV